MNLRPNLRLTTQVLSATALAIALGATAWALDGERGLLVAAVLLASAALALLARTRMPRHQPHLPPPDSAPAPSHEAYPRFRRLHMRLSWGQVSARHFDGSTRPELERVAFALLRERRGIDLVRDPAAAREALGAEAWELVRPDRHRSTDSAAPGPPLDHVARLVQRLEEL
jgi:hypothetical protein